MKITNVRACQPVTETSPDDWRTSIGQILVAVDTDCGVTGYGVGGGGFAGIHVVQTVLRDVLLDRDPDPIEELWSEMYDATLAFGQKGIVLMAMSGVDLALWDVRGRAENQSVTELLGGAKQTRLPTYITVWDNEALAKVVDRPHRGLKLHLGEQAPQNESVDEFADRIAGELREARRLIGPERELMADAWMEKWSRPAAQAVSVIGDVNLSWLETIAAGRRGWLRDGWSDSGRAHRGRRHEYIGGVSETRRSPAASRPLTGRQLGWRSDRVDPDLRTRGRALTTFASARIAERIWSLPAVRHSIPIRWPSQVGRG